MVLAQRIKGFVRLKGLTREIKIGWLFKLKGSNKNAFIIFMYAHENDKIEQHIM